MAYLPGPCPLARPTECPLAATSRHRPTVSRRPGFPTLLPSSRRAGRQPEAAAEAAVEIGQVVEAAVEGDVADAAFGLARQQLGRLAQAQFIQAHGEAGARFIEQFV